MSRSVWKGPYVHPSVLKKTAVANEKNSQSTPIVIEKQNDTIAKKTGDS